jgi:hypothetical protein
MTFPGRRPSLVFAALILGTTHAVWAHHAFDTNVVSARELEYQATQLASDKEFLAILTMSDGLLKLQSGDPAGTDLVVWSSEKLRDLNQESLGIFGLDAANQRGAFLDPLFYVRKRASLAKSVSPNDAAASLKASIDQTLLTNQPSSEIFLAANDLLKIRMSQGGLSLDERQSLLNTVRLNQNPQGLALISKRQMLLELIEDAWIRQDYPIAAELQQLLVDCLGDMWAKDGNRVLWNLRVARQGRLLKDMTVEDVAQTKLLWSSESTRLFPEWLTVFNNLMTWIQWSQPEGISMIQESLRVAKEQLPSWLALTANDSSRREQIDHGIADLIHIGSQHAKMNCRVLRDLLSSHETTFPASDRRVMLDRIKPALLHDCP